ncbi:uncharacterized protein LOC122021780 isoform X1 [Zingiber officinale]|uniref:Stress up-regulated Nod 19 protein n=2 Tax=Zingiber officinale TaxID=94328 RepID=A0A8J5F775_ZINOF|nr:uncharacterized protein LOC122021780 isoform X1 [Zingiber officinale]KAG6480136.1 hypothetical protein ZIOFF_063614 [Zingiber officinale]
MKHKKITMPHIQSDKLLLLLLFVQLSFTSLIASQRQHQRVKSAVFLSPPLTLRPGSVASKLYYNVPFPRGHIALKSFNGEVVDGNGTPVPLHETYLHHWVMERYYARKGGAATETNYSDIKSSDNSSYIWARNAGICIGTLRQHFGLGSETRRTDTWVPDPYGIEVGNPSQVPDGYEERWVLNIHAIDTRGVVDRLGCTECKCSLYNVTKDEFGAPLPKHYVGGLYCCHDQTQCKVREGYGNVARTLHLRYTVKWLDWLENHLVPVKIYIFDVTDSGEPVDPTEEDPFKLSCKIEYQVEACRVDDNTKCVDSKKVKLVMAKGGDIVYGVAHQHTAGVGAALYGQDGRVLCTSNPKYGEGEDVGDEVGYIVGMSACYPEPGSVRVTDGEVLTLESNYSSSQAHTGVMGLFYILVAEVAPGEMELPKHTLSFVLAGGVLMAAAGICYLWKKRKNAAYETLAIA